MPPSENIRRVVTVVDDDGKAVVLDIDIAPDGPALSQGTWYQRYSIAEIRKKKLNANA